MKKVYKYHLLTKTNKAANLEELTECEASFRKWVCNTRSINELEEMTAALDKARERIKKQASFTGPVLIGFAGDCLTMYSPIYLKAV